MSRIPSIICKITRRNTTETTSLLATSNDRKSYGDDSDKEGCAKSDNESEMEV
jgi:hypothetical protein